MGRTPFPFPPVFFFNARLCVIVDSWKNSQSPCENHVRKHVRVTTPNWHALTTISLLVLINSRKPASAACTGLRKEKHMCLQSKGTRCLCYTGELVISNLFNSLWSVFYGCGLQTSWLHVIRMQRQAAYTSTCLVLCAPQSEPT